MTLEKIVERWIAILRLVHIKDTGNPRVLAKKLGVSTVTLYKDIKYLNNIIKSGSMLDVTQSITYDEAKKSYIFKS